MTGNQGQIRAGTSENREFSDPDSVFHSRQVKLRHFYF